ncbi:hypothetical protein IMSHALPRED_005771, partial [Imshaugia aleurites]
MVCNWLRKWNTTSQGTSVATPQVAGVAAILIVAYGMRTAAQVKETIVRLAHSKNGGPHAIYVGNPGEYCRTRRKRAARLDKRAIASESADLVCEAEPFSTTNSAVATAKVT